MNLPNFDSESIELDWLSFNILGLHDPRTIASSLSKYFKPYVAVDGEPVLFCPKLEKECKVSIRHYTGCKGYWVGTQVIFFGKNAARFYRLIKNYKISWEIVTTENGTLSLGRIDLYFSRPNKLNDTVQSFDAFLIASRSQIQTTTTTPYIYSVFLE